MKYPFGFMGASGGQYDNPYNVAVGGFRTLLNTQTSIRSVQYLDNAPYSDDVATYIRTFRDEYSKQQNEKYLSDIRGGIPPSNVIGLCEYDLTDKGNFYFEQDYITYNTHGIQNLGIFIGEDFEINYLGYVNAVVDLPVSGNLKDIIWVDDADEFYWWNPDVPGWVENVTGNFIYNNTDVSEAFSEAIVNRDLLLTEFDRTLKSYEADVAASNWYPSFQIEKYKI
jgi:hypothetical protein